MEAKTTLRVPDFMKPILEDIRLLRSDGNNPNRMTSKQKDELWNSIEEFGWTDPILTNQDGVFTDGEQRVSVCIAHGEFYAPVYRMNDLSEVQRRRLRLIANELKGKHNKELEEEGWQRIIELGQREELVSFLDSMGEKLPETLRDEHEKVSIIPETYEFQEIELLDSVSCQLLFSQTPLRSKLFVLIPSQIANHKLTLSHTELL